MSSLYCLFTHMSNSRLDELRSYLRLQGSSANVICTEDINILTNGSFYGKSVRVNFKTQSFLQEDHNNLIVHFPELKPLFIYSSGLILSPISFFTYLPKSFQVTNWSTFLSLPINSLRLLFNKIRCSFISSNFFILHASSLQHSNTYCY